MKLIFFSLLIALNLSSFAQLRNVTSSKPIIDTNALDKWNWLDLQPIISNNGKYVAYKIKNYPIGKNTLFIREIEGSWKKEIARQDFDSYGFFFSADSKKLVCKTGDSLLIIELGSDRIEYRDNVSALIRPGDKGINWMMYKLNSSNNEVVFCNFINGASVNFRSILSFTFNESGGEIILYSQDAQRNTLKMLNPESQEINELASFDNSCKVGSFAFNKSGSTFAFVVTENNSNSIWLYKKGMTKAQQFINKESKGIDSGLVIGKYGINISANGHWLFFNLCSTKKEIHSVLEKYAKVDVWGYRDQVLQPQQLRLAKQNSVSSFMAVSSTNEAAVVRLQQENENVLTNPSWWNIQEDYTIVYDQPLPEYWWQKDVSFWLVSLKDGSRKRLLKNHGESFLFNPSFSPDGRFLVYWLYANEKKAGYYSYNVQSGKTINISATIPEKMGLEYQYLESTGNIGPVATIAGWCSLDNSLLLYDNYDIWRVNPSGKGPPICITHQYGKEHNVKLRLVLGKDDNINPSNFGGKETLLLCGFDWLTKHNGFYQVGLDGRKGIELLMSAPYLYYVRGSQTGGGYVAGGMGMQPLKALNADIWILQRQSAEEAPNYFFTNNFKTYTPLTNFQPQKEFNWLTATLITWRLPDGRLSQGVLYKPENFDSTKKYPLIFHFYEKMSHNMYRFWGPGLTTDEINIPWFVSRGYLVFTPDIHYSLPKETGIPIGQSASQAVISAAKYLVGRYSYINSKAMALQGHSFGGLETAYITTHSNIFAAACEVSGSTDPISAYLTLIGPEGNDEVSKQSGIEKGHEAYGATPWERPDLYLKNSSVLSANKTTTPLLIAHNKKDNQVQWRQGVELYMALRRLQKPCWMLQYDDGVHTIDCSGCALDFTIRLNQFFDHYLKNALPPSWMTKGVAAIMKNIATGYEIDSSGNCSIYCPICKKSKERLNAKN